MFVIDYRVYCTSKFIKFILSGAKKEIIYGPCFYMQ